MTNDMFIKLMTLFGIPDIKKPGYDFDERLSIPKKESSRHTYSYFTEDELKQLRSKDIINWVFSDDTWFTKRNYLTRESYISDVVDRGGILGLSNGILYEPDTNAVINMRLFDIGDCNSPVARESKRAQKTFKKWVKDFNIIESIYRRFLKIQYGVLAFYKACDQHYLGGSILHD